VLITVEYRVPGERASDFLEAMDEMRIFRRREGAVRWDLFRDLAEPDRYLERQSPSRSCAASQRPCHAALQRQPGLNRHVSS
jgi:hypothetical protein